MSINYHLLYHFDRVFTISEKLLSEKAEKLSFILWWILNQTVFLAVTCDWTPGRNDTVLQASLNVEISEELDPAAILQAEQNSFDDGLLNFKAKGLL